MSSPLAGAEITTFFAPAARCFAAASRSVKRPVLSSTSSTPSSFHGSCSGSLMAVTRISPPRRKVGTALAEIRKDGPAERHGQDGSHAGALQGPRGLGERGAGGEDVVHENQCGVRNAECGVEHGWTPHSALRIPHFERP